MQATIDKHISQLLFDHECVVVPDFGAFLTRYYTAEINSATYMMRPPSRRVSFNKRVSENDGLLAKHISREESISYTQALESIAISVRGWKRILGSGKKVNLPGIGRLYMDNESRVQFNPAIDINYDKTSYGLEIFRSPAIQRKAEITKTIQRAIDREIPVKTPEEKQKRDFAAWRWAAVITPLLGLGIAAGVYFNDISSFTNFSGLTPFSYSSSHKSSGNAEKTTSEAPAPEIETQSSGELIKETVSEEVSAKTEVSAHSYHIVVGSFKERGNAQNYVSDLRSKGIDAYIAEGNDHFSRVAIGNYNSHEQANQQLLTVKNEVNSGSWIYAN